MRKRILSILLTLCMVLSIAPTAAFAEGEGNTNTGKAIQIGTSQIEGGQASSVYFGNYQQSSDGNGGYNTDPIKWRVLSNADGKLFLLADQNLDVKPYNTSRTSITWEKSTIRSWLNGYEASQNNAGTDYSSDNFIDTAFSSEEQGTIADTYVYNATQSDRRSNPNPNYRTSGGNNTTDKIFLLSIEEANNSSYFPNGNDSRISTNTAYVASHSGMSGVGAADYWWMRSPGVDAELAAFTGVNVGVNNVNNAGDYVDYTNDAARPAFNLNTSSVLFTSAAEGGKSSGTVGADALKSVSDYSGNEWKLTLLDKSRSFSANANGQTSASALAGGSVQITYSGAQTGENEYVSVLLCDGNGNVLYYGNIAQSSASGTASVAVPDGLAAGDYTLKVFSEQCNGDKKTDYASDFVNIDLTITPDEQFSLTPGGRYYFDLSAMNIPGTANGGNSDGAVSLPDTSLHYVPFTYVGTIEAYKLTSATATTEEYAQQNKYPHSLFVADYAVTHTISWGGLNDEGLIFGKNYASGGVDYTLRAPSVGSNATGSGDSQRGVPQSNEWDTILDKKDGYIKNGIYMYSWGQDTHSISASYRAIRGYDSARFWVSVNAAYSGPCVGFRPVLELPTNLAADSLKIVELLTGEFMPGEQQNWINIIVKKGESFTAPAAEGLPRPDGISADAQLWWADDNFNFYKPGDTVPADVSSLIAFYGGFGLFLDRGDGAVEVTPDNYTDIFGDGTASFVLPKGKTLTELERLGKLTGNDILGIYSTGRLEKYGCVFPNLKLKNADLTSVRLSEEYIGHENPLFVTLDGKNTVGSLNGIIESDNTLCVIGDGSLTLNGALTLGRYTQFGGGSVTMTDGLTAYDLTVDSGSLTVTGDPQAITLANQALGDLQMGDGVRLFLGFSAQDAAEAVIPQLSAEMQEVYQRYLADDNTLTYEELVALNNALRERFNAIFRQLPGKTYVRITGAWDVTYQPGENGDGNAVTDIKFYNDILTLRGKLFTRTGYTQTGWATVDGGEKVYGLDDIYTKNEALTLYPVWNTNKYTITFDTNGGSEIAPITQDYGTAITAPADPTREGYTFIGWDTEIPTTMPAENITLKAKWKDIEKPTGEIKISENSWKAFLNNITFGLFFKDTQTVTITAADNSGETVTVEYLLSDKELTKAELDGMTFTAYTAPFGIDPDNEYIIYVRLTDNAGNTDYICSDGIVLDGTSPVITGIENGKTYCEAQTVTVDEKYVDTVTVNGTAVTLDATGSFTLAPADGEQKIVVTDKAGNTAEMTVTVNDGHTFGEWTSNGDGTHTRQCTVDGCNGLETKDCSGGKATCAEKAVCEVCGESYGELNANNHADMKHIEAKAATKTAEGNIEYWYCEDCDKYFADKDGNKEITKADTVTAKLPDEKPTSPKTGDTSNLALWIVLLFISGGVITVTTVVSKKKRHS